MLKAGAYPAELSAGRVSAARPPQILTVDACRLSTLPTPYMHDGGEALPRRAGQRSATRHSQAANNEAT